MLTSFNISDSFMVWVFRFLPIVFIGYILYFSIKVIIERKRFLNTDINSPEDERVYRQKLRGTIIAILTSGVTFLVMMALHSIGAPIELLETNYNFLFSNTIGYIADRVFGTDEGLRLVKDEPNKMGMLSMKVLSETSFLRFFLATMLDMFVIIPFLALMGKYTESFQYRFRTNWYDKLILKNIRLVLLIIVSAVTFQAFTNMTKFQWAYPSEKEGDLQRISDATMFSILGSACGMFALYYIVMPKGKATLGLGTFYILVTLALMAVLAGEKRPNEALQEQKIKRIYDDKGFYMGLAIFFTITAIGFLYPLFRR